MQLVVTVGIVAGAIWVLAIGFVLALARTAKSADRAGRRLIVAKSGLPATHPVGR